MVFETLQKHFTMPMLEPNGPSEVTFVQFKESDEWRVRKNRLLTISPTDAGAFNTGIDGFTVWDLYFIQNLVHIENTLKGLLLDVGWYPHADPSGTYRLLLVRSTCLVDSGKAEIHVDWDNPIIDFQTRSLQELSKMICDILVAPEH